MRPFEVDVDDVEAVVGDLVATQRRLEALADDLDTQIRALHAGWDGLGAAAHADAHRRWRASLDELRLALATLSAAGARAAGSYRAASGDNVAMWSQLR